MAQSKGLSKKHSARQKEHYAAHPYKILRNKLARLKRHIHRVEKHIAKRAKKGVMLKLDKQAMNALKRLS